MDLPVKGLEPSSRFCIVAKLEGIRGGALQCRGISPEQCFEIFDAPELAEGIYTFVDLVKGNQDLTACTFGETTEAFKHPQKSDFQRVAIYDLCSGMGGFTIGSKIVGMSTAAFVERNELACMALRANFEQPILHGDVADPEILKQLLKLKQECFIQVTGGFPCQGYSRQGDQGGLDDMRSHTIHRILDTAWFLQADAVLLECVANVTQFPETQECIDRYAALASMSCHKLVFDLQHQWPCRRNRFWCHMIAKDFPAIYIPSWPSTLEYQSLQDIMPLDAMWAPADEQQLQWDEAEMAIYMDPSFGPDQRILRPNDKAPTALHSWGHVTRPCSCGCRLAFSAQRLQQGGARGFGLVSACTGHCRHLHPFEGALLCTVPGDFCFPMPPRAALCLLGQIAAPLQVLWVQSHILAGLQFHAWGWTGIDPSTCIKFFQQYLVDQVKRRWITPLMYQPRQIQIGIEDEQQVITVSLHQPATVMDLVTAERSLCGWGHYAIVKQDGHRLPLDTLLHEGVKYTVELRKSAQVRPFLAVPITGGGPAATDLGLGDHTIWPYMKALASHFGKEFDYPEPWVTYPFRANQLLQLQLHEAVWQSWHISYNASNGHVYVICELDCHWFLLTGHPDDRKRGLTWTLYDGLRQGHQLPILVQVAQKLCYALDLDFLGLCMGQGLLQAQPFTCGTIALVHMALDLCLTTVDAHFDLQELHTWLLAGQTGGTIIAGGPNLPMDLQTKLATLLQQHGVPAEAVPERVQQVTLKLGVSSIKEAFEAKNCWAYLKAIASRPSISMRLVLPDELSRHVATTAATKFGAQVTQAKQKKKKQEHKAPPRPLNPDPEHLVLAHTSFQDPDGDVVEQISFNDVEAEATGVAICTLAQAYHFMQSKQSISTRPLAILTTERPPKEYMEEHCLTEISFAAKYTGTGEPILIFGALKNLGDIEITRHIPGAVEQPSLVPTQVIKVQVFRDEYQGDWQLLANSPVRALCQAVPLLQLCPGKDCGSDCPKSHAAVDEELDSILLEIWSRTFTKLEGGKISASEAQIFGVFLRIPESILDTLLQSGTPGIYFEPRSAVTKGHDERYRVIWLSARTYDEAIHTCRTNIHALGLVRMKRKYGIRVMAEHEEQTFKQIKPDATWVNAQVQRIFQLFPLPHGLQRGGVIKLLKDHDWAVKPLQPGKGSADAMSWQVGAATPPPSDIITGFGKEILITEITREGKPVPPPKLVASAKTQQHLRAEASAPSSASTAALAGDPWMLPGRDPWKPTAMHKNPNQGKSQLKEVTGNLKDELAAAMDQKFAELQLDAKHQEPDGFAEHKADSLQRFAKLETSLGEMQAQQLQFSGWFTNLHQQAQLAETSIQGIQYTLNTHQAELQGLHQDIKGVSEQVGQAVHSALQNHKAEVSQDLDTRFDRLEALFSNKKHRSE